MCDKAYFDLKNFRLWELTHELLALNLPLYISPTPSNPYPARHIPSFGRAWGGFPSWLSEPPISHRILSHPLLRRGLGRLLLFGFGPPSLVRALFLFVNFFPSCFPIYALLRSKRCPFTLQKGVFYNAKEHVLFSSLPFLFTFSVFPTQHIASPVHFQRLLYNKVYAHPKHVTSCYSSMDSVLKMYPHVGITLKNLS